ncbi:MAG: BatA and WFA domain-containing protein, partial [Planctomycetaceae bacterium]
MYFGNPWGLLALLSLPAIAVIHLYHRRFPRLEIAGLHLWGLESEVRTAGRRRDRLPITATLLLELLAALLLSLVLAEPRWRDSSSVEHLVVVLDSSASMSAKIGENRTIRDAAIDSLTSRADELPRGSVFSLIVTGRRPTMLAGPAASWDVAKNALTAWRPSAPRHEFQAAWDLAAQLAEDSGQLLFMTDRVPEFDQPVPKRMELLSVGRALENVAITAARWTFDSRVAKGHVFLRVKQFGLRAIDAQLI